MANHSGACFAAELSLWPGVSVAGLVFLKLRPPYNLKSPVSFPHREPNGQSVTNVNSEHSTKHDKQMISTYEACEVQITV